MSEEGVEFVAFEIVDSVESFLPIKIHVYIIEKSKKVNNILCRSF